MVDFGAFAGGMARGLEPLPGVLLRQQELALKDKERVQKEQERMNAATKEVAELVQKALLLPDNLRGQALSDAALAADALTGQKDTIPKTFVQWATKNPQDAANLANLAASQGMPPEVMLATIKNPLLRARVLVAYGEAERARAISEAAAGNAPHPPVAPQQAPASEFSLGGGPTGLGTGGNAPSSPASAPAAAGEGGGGLAAPTEALEGEAKRLEAQIAGLDKRIAAMRAQRAAPNLVAPLQQERGRLEDRLADIRVKPAVAVAEEQRKPISQEEADDLKERLVGGGRRDLAERVRVGMPRNVAEALNAGLAPASGGEGTPAPAPTPAGGTGAAPSGGPSTPGSATRPLTEAERITQRETIERRTKALPEELLREPQVQALGINTVGQFEDARSRGLLQNVRTPEQVQAFKDSAQQLERIAGKELEDIHKTAKDATDRKAKFERIFALSQAAGRTGALTGPMRQAFGQALALVLPPETADRISNLPRLEALDQANVELALIGLKGLGGNDTERELKTMLEANPGLRRQPETNRLVVRWAIAAAQREEEKALAADRWITQREADGKAPSLRSRDPEGMTFNQRWMRYQDRNPLFGAVARDLGLDPEALATSMGMQLTDEKRRALGMIR